MNDMTLSVNTLAGRGIGDNRPSLAELIAEEIEPLRIRANELLGAVAKVRITNETEAGKAADLVLLIHNLENELDSIRKRRKKPFLADCRAVDAVFGALIAQLARARAGDEAQAGLVEMIGQWQAKNDDQPIYASYASIGSRREIQFVIEDIPAAIGWLIQNRACEITQAARTIIGTVLRGIGVEQAAEAGIPGVSVTITSKTQVR